MTTSVDRVQAVEAVVAACAAADGAAPIDEATTLALRAGELGVLLHPGAHGGERDAVGFALLGEGSVDLAVRPEARRGGVGRALLERALEQRPGPLQAWSHGDHPAAARLAATHGFDRVRDLWVMRRSLREDLPDPGGDVPVRDYRPSDRDALLEVNAAAFAHHPEQGAMDARDLERRMAQDWFDPAGLLVADDPGRPGRLLGFHWTKQHSPTLGEVYVVGIDPHAQGRGLGRALTLAGLHHLRTRGVDDVLLYVESDNAPAVATYGRLGFTHAAHDTHVMYARPA